MKVSRIYTIDIDLVKRLEQIDNKSQLIERLLKQYFELNGNKSLSIEQKNDLMLKEMKKKSKELKNKNKIIKEVNSWGIDTFCIKRLLMIPPEIDPLNGASELDIKTWNEWADYCFGRKIKNPKKVLEHLPFLYKHEKIIREVYLGDNETANI